MKFVIYRGQECMVSESSDRVVIYSPLLADGMEGFVYSDYHQAYYKTLSYSEISECEAYYEVSYRVIYKGQEFQISTEMTTTNKTERLDRADQEIRLYTDDLDFMREHDLFEDAHIVEHHYGHLYYLTKKLLLSEVLLITSIEYLKREKEKFSWFKKIFGK